MRKSELNSIEYNFRYRMWKIKKWLRIHFDKRLFEYATNVGKKRFCDDYRKLLNKTTSDTQIIKMFEQRFRYIIN